MAVEPVMDAERWFEGMRNALPPTADDVTILVDGTRMDSRENVIAWLAQVEAIRVRRPTADVDT